MMCDYISDNLQSSVMINRNKRIYCNKCSHDAIGWDRKREVWNGPAFQSVLYTVKQKAVLKEYLRSLQHIFTSPNFLGFLHEE